MLREIGWEQLTEWMEYERIEPFGDRRADWQMASLCSLIANLEMAKTRSQRRYSSRDFLLQFCDADTPTTPTTVSTPAPAGQSWQYLKTIARMHVKLSDAQREQRQKGRKRRT